MTTKLIQKRFLKGTREFEIIDDTIDVRIRAPFNKARLTLSLDTLNPEPVVNGPWLEFYGHGTGEPLLSMLVDVPTPLEFFEFVDTLKRAMEKYQGSAGVGAAAGPAGLNGNVYHEPPGLDASDEFKLHGNTQAVNVDRIEQAIELLKTYLATEDIGPFIAALEGLKAEPRDASRMDEVVKAFDDLGITQGAVLTYAPYISILLSKNPY